MSLTPLKIQYIIEKEEMISKQLDVMLRENSFMIYHTLVMFGSLRPRDIQSYTNIATGRMYNEIAKLLEVGLIKKEKIKIDDVPKSFYTTIKDNPIENISNESYDISNLIHKDPETLRIFEILLKYITNFPILFQNFISKVAGNLILKHIETEDQSKGDFTTFQKIIKISNEDYDILRSRITLLIRDLNINLEPKSNATNQIAINLGLFRYRID